MNAKSSLQSRLLKVLSASALAVVFASEGAQAIVNIESLRLQQRNQGTGGSLGAAWERREGNTDNLRLKLNGQLIHKTGEFENLGIIERELGEANGAKDIDRTTGHLRTTWPANEKISAEAYTQLERNQFTRLSLRGILGAGARFRFVNEENFALFAGAGAFWARETLEFAPDTTDAGTEDQWRGNYYLSLHFPFPGNIDITNTTYVQPLVRSIGDFRVLQTTQANLNVNKWLAVGLLYSLTYDSQPPQKVQKSDQQYGTNFIFKF